MTTGDRPRIGAALLILAIASSLACGPEQSELIDDARVATRRGLDQAGREIEQARERYQIDEKVDQARRELGDKLDDQVERAREQLERGIDEAAAGFEALAEQGLEQGAEVSEQLAYQPLPGAAEAIACEGARCKMDAAFIDRLAENPQQLTREAMLLPGRTAEGRPGLALARVQPGSIPALLGLRDGDLLLELNGTALGSLAAIRAVDDALAGRDQAELSYERDGVQATLVVLREPPGRG
ncbi:MAG: hypothetical protein KC457_23925 [Myxococcales bacterium]|nr:hypothetical protein [Myxococcales bacterium]